MKYLEIMPSVRQTSWGWPALVNLTLGSAGAGLYLLSVFISAFGQQGIFGQHRIAYQLLAPAIVCVGFLCVMIEAGKVSHAYHLLANLRHSWMSVESLVGAGFILTSLISYFKPFAMVTIFAGMMAFALMTSQGMMVYGALAITAWNDRLIPVVSITSGIVGACGFFLLNTLQLQALDNLTIMSFLICVLLNLLTWMAYLSQLFHNQGADFKKAVSFLKRLVILLVLVTGIGHVVPLCFLTLFLFTGGHGHAWLTDTVLRVGLGLMLIAGSVCQKGGVILAAGYFRTMIFESSATEKKPPRMGVY